MLTSSFTCAGSVGKDPAAGAQPGETRRRDIIEEYTNFASKVYAPKTREGLFTDKLPPAEPQPFLLETHDGLCMCMCAFW